MRRNKFNAVKCWVLDMHLYPVPKDKQEKEALKLKMTERGGILFDSKKEALRYITLTIMEKEGGISELILQPEFELLSKEEDKVTGRGVTYRADFAYLDKDGRQIVEDTKSPATATDVYKIKKKFLYAFYGEAFDEFKET